jgi:hypothetical protein
MVRTDSVDLFDLIAERHRVVNQKLDEIMRGGFSGQQFEFSVYPIDPSSTDTGGNLRGRRWSQKKKGPRKQIKCTHNDGAQGIQDFTRLPQ